LTNYKNRLIHGEYVYNDKVGRLMGHSLVGLPKASNRRNAIYMNNETQKNPYAKNKHCTKNYNMLDMTIAQAGRFAQDRQKWKYGTAVACTYTLSK